MMIKLIFQNKGNINIRTSKNKNKLPFSYKSPDSKAKQIYGIEDAV